MQILKSLLVCIFRVLEGCPRFWLVGCFADNVRAKPALGDLLFTDRDRSSHVYSGKNIEWFDFEPYLDR